MIEIPAEDNINSPKHYKLYGMDIESIDVIRAVDHDLDGTEGFFTGNVLKYMIRWKKKNGIEDLQKARKYLDWLIEYEGGKA